MKISTGMQKTLINGVGFVISLLAVTGLFRVINDDKRNPLFAWMQTDKSLTISIDIALIIIGFGIIMYSARLKQNHESKNNTDSV